MTAAPAARADESVDLDLGALRSAASDRPIPLSAANEGPAAVLAAAAGVEAFPVPCASPLLAAAADAPPATALGQALALVAMPPSAPDARVVPTRDGHFMLLATAPAATRPHAPDAEFVARVAEALVAARAYLTATMGYPDPAPGPERVAVHLARLGRGLEAYSVPSRPGRPARAPYVVIDAALPADRIMPAVLHQMAHLALSRMGTAEPWWHEAIASYLTLAGTGDLEPQRPALEAWLGDPSLGLRTESLRRMQGALVWPLFLAERTGDPGVVRRIAEETAQGGLDAMPAADVVLRADWGLSLAAALREMAIWNLHTGSRDDGRHYTAGPSLPEAALFTLGPSLPIVMGPIEPIEPAGSIAFRLDSDRARGALALTIEARGGLPGADLLVFYPGERGPALVPVDLTGAPGKVIVPWRDAVAAWIVLRNDAVEAGALPARFDLTLSRDVRAPFDLAAFTASPQGGAIALEWTTAVEEGLAGWNILRSEAPEGPFARLNGVAMPAWGDAEADTGYIFVDAAVRPGRRYYYALEAITTAGLAERTHVTSARAADRRRGSASR